MKSKIQISSIHDVDLYHQTLGIFTNTLDAALRTGDIYLQLKYKYFDYYLQKSHLFYIAHDSTTVYGYICGALNSLECFELFQKIAHYKTFQGHYIDYPSHLHINCHPGFQGLGIGSQLLGHFSNAISELGSTGLHLITGVKERNVSFYKKNEFVQVSLKGDLLMLGKSL